MNREKKQLFRLLLNVDVSHEARYNPAAKTYVPAKLVVPATFAVTWPDGTPCSLVEIYLIAKFRRGATVREDGGSLRATASKLSHLIRHCWQIQRDFWELCDEDIDSLILHLMAEMKLGAPLIRARGNNTIRAIVAASVEFLLWLQNEQLVGYHLIGKGRSYRVRLIEKKVYDATGRQQGIHLVYCRLPPADTREPKRPMSRERRNLLWQAVTDLSASDRNFPAWTNNTDNQLHLKMYLKARRELLLELLEATGARPGELARLSVTENEDCYKNEELILVTLKRRRDISRKIKLQPSVAMRLTVFVRKHRSNFLRLLDKSGVISHPMDHVFLGCDGNPMTSRSLVTEFCRLSKVAGVGEYQSCMSMFRHRFITKQVALHLGIYLDDKNKTKDLMTDGDYRTILKKVATVTGHGSEVSLLHYLDMAWDELGVFDRLEAAQQLDSAIEGAATKVISLIGDLQFMRENSRSQILDLTVETLKKLQQEIRLACALGNRPSLWTEITSPAVFP